VWLDSITILATENCGKYNLAFWTGQFPLHPLNLISLSVSSSRWLRVASTIRLDITYGCWRVCFAANPKRVTSSTRPPPPGFWPSIPRSYALTLRGVISTVCDCMTADLTLHEFLTLCSVHKAGPFPNLCGCTRNIAAPNLFILWLLFWQCTLNTEVLFTK
jgi:hypothetical protein